MAKAPLDAEEREHLLGEIEQTMLRSNMLNAHDRNPNRLPAAKNQELAVKALAEYVADWHIAHLEAAKRDLVYSLMQWGYLTPEEKDAIFTSLNGSPTPQPDEGNKEEDLK